MKDFKSGKYHPVKDNTNVWDITGHWIDVLSSKDIIEIKEVVPSQTIPGKYLGIVNDVEDFVIWEFNGIKNFYPVPPKKKKKGGDSDA